jgi:hypothetical protein
MNLALWRYMDFAKFVALLTSKKLFLSRADKFEDRFEGSYSNANIRSRHEAYKGMANEDLEKHLAEMTKLTKWIRQWTYVSC